MAAAAEQNSWHDLTVRLAVLESKVGDIHDDVKAVLAQQREDRRATRNAILAFAAPVTAAIVSGAVALILGL